MPARLQPVDTDPTKPDFCVEFTIESGKESVETLDLLLTLNLWEKPLTSCLGEISVGLKRVRLEVTLSNATMPLALRQPKYPLPMRIKKKRTIGRQVTEEGASLKTTNLGTEAGPKGPKISGGITTSDESKKSLSNSSQEEFEVRDQQILMGGTEAEPVWHLEDKSGSGILEGMLVKESIGKLLISGKPCSVIAEFKAAPRDISIVGRGGIFPEEMNKSHRAVRTAVLYFWLGAKVRPHLARKRFEVRNA
jgi:hypothetical protein